jgi:tripartite-type tricarboxylate transporter receptor subunit TctC
MNCWKVGAAVLFALGTTLSSGSANAQKFPDRAITLICPFTPGAAADAQLRALAQALSKEIGQPVIVDNKPGAAGTVGAAVLAGARPDGYTLAQVTNTIIRQPFIAKTSFDPIRDFTYVIGVSTFDFGLVVDANSPWKTFAEFTNYAKQNPGKVSYGTIGNGSVPHQVMNRIGTKLGIEWAHVPYKGSGPAQIDLQGGHLTALSDTTGWSPFVDSGKFRLLAVYGDKRLKRYPNAPTLKELGLDIVDSAPWGIAAPKGLDPARVKFLHDAIRKAMADPGFIQSLDVMANDVYYMSTSAYQKYMAGRVAIEQEVVEKYGLRQ